MLLGSRDRQSRMQVSAGRLAEEYIQFGGNGTETAPSIETQYLLEISVPDGLIPEAFGSQA